ncbi:MAG: T9SS type A sorting domain-containing protein, partial [Cytophagales bacterium]|nr:T9SS type A sorting domain-containing protein [Cytophagales bacterium]
IALNCNYGYDDGKGNFNILNDSKLVYSIHTYDPYEYTTQLQPWANTGDGGKYPDESILSLPGDLAYATGNYTNPKLPTGNSNWTYFTGNPFTITVDSLIIGKPVFQGNFLGAGKAYFDEITINEVNSSGAVIQQLFTFNFTSTTNVSYWSANNTGGLSFSTSGPNDNSSLVLTGSSNYASATANNLPFKVYKNKRYQINGWMKGENIPANATAAITTEFYASPTRQKVYGRNKEYLRSMLLQFTKYPRQNNFPIYYGEFGVVRNCFDNNKGGEVWVTDMMQLFDSLNIHWTYHVYREGGFGMYDGVTGDVDTTTVKLPLEQAFNNYFGKVTQTPKEGNSLNNWTPNVYPNPFQTVFQIDNTEPTDIHVELFDVLGKSLEKQMVTSGSKALIGNKEESGLYILFIEGEKGKKFVRVVKE